MAGIITLSKTLDGAAISDGLLGGGVGLDLGPSVNGQYGPIVSKAANTGQQDLYISHDGTVSITDFSCYIQQFGTDTGFAYGGQSTAATDFTNLVSIGTASGTSKNNADGLSGGLWLEMDADIAVTSQFDILTRPTFVKQFGTAGVSLATKHVISSAAMVYNNSGEQQASSPVDGEIGAAGDTTLGDAAHLQYRAYLPSSGSPFSGKEQFELVFAYAFTV